MRSHKVNFDGYYLPLALDAFLWRNDGGKKVVEF